MILTDNRVNQIGDGILHGKQKVKIISQGSDIITIGSIGEVVVHVLDEAEAEGALVTVGVACIGRVVGADHVEIGGLDVVVCVLVAALKADQD